MVVAILLGACSTPGDRDAGSTTVATATTVSASSMVAGRVQPRPPGFWVIWSTCGDDNRAAEAVANGGADEGFFLMDDFLASPGVTTGDFVVATCEQGVRLLEAVANSGDAPYMALAGLLLAADLSLSAGSERCPDIEEVTAASQILLSSVGFDGDRIGVDAVLDAGLTDATERLSSLLEQYIAGTLC